MRESRLYVRNHPVECVEKEGCNRHLDRSFQSLVFNSTTQRPSLVRQYGSDKSMVMFNVNTNSNAITINQKGGNWLMCEKDVRGNRERTSFYIYERDEREREREREKRMGTPTRREKREENGCADACARAHVRARAIHDVLLSA